MALELDYHYQDYDASTLITQIIMQSITATIFLFTAIILIRKYKKNKNKDVLYLIITMIFISLGIYLGTIPMPLVLLDPSINLINGISIGGGYHIWWTSLSLCLVGLSNISLFLFTNSIFEKPKQKIFPYFTILVVIFAIWIILRGIFIVKPGTSAMDIGLSILFVLILFYIWGSLFKNSLQTIKKLEPSVFRSGLITLNIAAFLTLLSYIFYGIGNVIQILTFNGLYWIVFAVVAFLVYMGYGMPKWYKNILEKYLEKREKLDKFEKSD